MAMHGKVEITDELLNQLNAVLEKELKLEFDEAIKRFQDRKNELCARVLLNVHKEISFSTLGETITFIIKPAKHE